MKKSLFSLLLAFCVLYCVKAQSLGAGISVDAQGNLKIDAPLYILTNTGNLPELKPAPASMNRPITAYVSGGGDFRQTTELTGGIVNGRLTLTVKIPDYRRWKGIKIFLGLPNKIITTGATVKAGYIDLIDENPYNRIILYDNLEVIKTNNEIGYLIRGDFYYLIYSLGEIRISGRANYSSYEQDFDIQFKKGWNITRLRHVSDYTNEGDLTTEISAPPTTEAIWVMFEEK